MDKPSPPEHDDAHAREDEDQRQNFRHFKGIRLRKWGCWVSEIRMPGSRKKLWLGSYQGAQQAARAYDAAVYCLKGPNANFNFPNSVPSIPSASSLSRERIQLAAGKHALDRLNSSPPSLKIISNMGTEEAALPSRLDSGPPDMDKPSPEEHDAAQARDDEDRGQNCRQFKGIRWRKWGRWVSEIRMPKSREKLWLGSYPTAQQAARAYDAAVYCLRGPNAKFNFPNSVPDIPSASSLSRRQIQHAAVKYALNPLHSNPPSV